MTERRYNEEEVAAIFRRAAESGSISSHQITYSSGFTLAELQEIGREVGIAPEAVAVAASSIDQVGRPTFRSFLGLPIGVGRTIDLQRRLNDSEWEQLVVDLRDTFDARGHLRSDGSLRQWTNGNLQALLEPTPTGHRLRLRTVKGSSRSLMGAGLGMLGAAAATFVATRVFGGAFDIGSLTGAGFLSMMGLGIFGIGALQLRGWARQRLRQMDEIISRLAQSGTTSGQLDGGGD